MNELMEWLANYAFEHGIGYILTNQLAPDTPSSSDGAHRLVIINMNWKFPKESPFSFAHEIGHVLNGDQGKNYFNANSLDLKTEYQANLTGIKILKDFCENHDISISNPIKFCEVFGIPEKLDYVVSLELSKG